jgi:hypothetical protein
MSLSIRHLEVLNNIQEKVFCRSPPLWAMGVEHALQAIAHGVGSYRDDHICMVDTHMGLLNFIGPDQSTRQPRQRLPSSSGHRSDVMSLSIRPLEVLNNIQDKVFCRSPPLWAMDVAHALQAISHGLGSYRDDHICMVDTHMGLLNFIGPDQSTRQPRQRLPSSSGSPCGYDLLHHNASGQDP